MSIIKTVDFETNDFSECSSASGTPTIVTSPAISGNRAAQLSPAPAEDWLQFTDSLNLSATALRGWFYFPTSLPSDRVYALVIFWNTANARNPMLLHLLSTGHLYGDSYLSVTGTRTGTKTLQVNTWYEISVAYSAAAGGFIKVWVRSRAERDAGTAASLDISLTHAAAGDNIDLHASKNSVAGAPSYVIDGVIVTDTSDQPPGIEAETIWDLDEHTTPALEDVLVGVDSPGSSPSDKKLVLSDFLATLALSNVNVQVLTSASGTYTPTSGMKKALVIAVGGGAGGHGGINTDSAGGGGGGGGASVRLYSAAEIGASKAYAVGAASSAAAAGNDTIFGPTPSKVIDFETGDLSQCASVGAGAPEVVTSPVYGGQYALHLHPMGGANHEGEQLWNPPTPPGLFGALFYYRFSATPDLPLNYLCGAYNVAAASHVASLQLSTGRQLYLDSLTLTIVGTRTGTRVLSANTWYEISYSYDNAAGGAIKVWVRSATERLLGIPASLDISVTHSDVGETIDQFSSWNWETNINCYADNFQITTGSAAQPFESLIARGGAAGAAGSQGGTIGAVAGGAGGLASGGDLDICGTPGQVGVVYSGTLGKGGRGGSSIFGFGGQGASATAGGAGTGYGGGGAGGHAATASDRAGGGGAAGVIYVAEFL